MFADLAFSGTDSFGNPVSGIGSLDLSLTSTTQSATFATYNDISSAPSSVSITVGTSQYTVGNFKAELTNGGGNDLMSLTGENLVQTNTGTVPNVTTINLLFAGNGHVFDESFDVETAFAAIESGDFFYVSPSSLTVGGRRRDINSFSYSVDVMSVPEPSAAFLAAAGMTGLLLRRRRDNVAQKDSSVPVLEVA